MSAQAWRTARWFVALGLCALVVLVAVPMTIDALTSSLVFGDAEGDEGDPADDEEAEPVEPAGEVPSGPVEDGSARAEADFVVQDGVVGQADRQRLAISQAGEVVVAIFPLIDGDPDCVGTATVEVHVQEAEPTELVFYAASIHRALDNSDEVDNPRLDDTVRAIAVTDGTPGRLLWDVTDLYRAWATGELAPAGTPLAVVIAPPDGFAEVRFSSLESGSDAPTLMWEGVPGCGEDVV